MANNSLPALVQALPAELYDEIPNLTFTVSTDSRTIDIAYQPPKLLQVNRASRELFAKSYYGQRSTFYIHKDLLKAFVTSLPTVHLTQITEIRITGTATKLYTLGVLGSMMEVHNILKALSVMPIEPIPSMSQRNVFRVMHEYPDGTQECPAAYRVW